MNILRSGISLSITVAVFYALCTVVWIMAPDAFLGFMNNLFHGMDFSGLVQASPFSWPGFFQAAIVMSLWAFLAGSFFAWLNNRLER